MFMPETERERERQSDTEDRRRDIERKETEEV